MTAVRYLLDEHIVTATAEGLRRVGVEALTVHEAERRTDSDESHLEWARNSGWIIVTHDGPFAGLAHRTPEHAGLVYCPDNKYRLGLLIQRLASLARTETLEGMRNRVYYL